MKRSKYPYYVGYQRDYYGSGTVFFYCVKCNGKLSGLEELFESICISCNKEDDDYSGSFCGQ